MEEHGLGGDVLPPGQGGTPNSTILELEAKKDGFQLDNEADLCPSLELFQRRFCIARIDGKVESKQMGGETIDSVDNAVEDDLFPIRSGFNLEEEFDKMLNSEETKEVEDLSEYFKRTVTVQRDAALLNFSVSRAKILDLLKDVDEHEQLVIPPVSELRKLVLEKVMPISTETLSEDPRGGSPSSENDETQNIDMIRSPPSPESSITSGKSSNDSGVETETSSPSGSLDIIDAGSGLEKQRRKFVEHSDSDSVGSSASPKKRKLASSRGPDFDEVLNFQPAKRKLTHGTAFAMQIPATSSKKLEGINPPPLPDVPVVSNFEPGSKLFAKRKAVTETCPKSKSQETPKPARKKLKITMPRNYGEQTIEKIQDQETEKTLSPSSVAIQPGSEDELLQQSAGHFPFSSAKVPELLPERTVTSPSPVANSDNNSGQSVTQTITPGTPNLIEQTQEKSPSSNSGADDVDSAMEELSQSPPDSSPSNLLLEAGDQLPFGCIEIQGVKYSINSQGEHTPLPLAEPVMEIASEAGVSTTNQNGKDEDQSSKPAVSISEDSHPTLAEIIPPSLTPPCTITIEDPSEGSTSMNNSPKKLLSLADLMMTEREKQLEHYEEVSEPDDDVLVVVETSRKTPNADIHKLNKLVEVLQSADPLQPLRYKCKLCSRIYSQRGNANFHIKTEHWKLNLFKCRQCSKSFPRKHHLEKHWKKFHPGLPLR